MTSSEDAPAALWRNLRWPAAALGLAAVLTVATLSIHDPFGLVPQGKGSYNGTVPTPNTSQEAWLRQAYRNVAPYLDDDQLVPAARALCRDILGGSTESYLIESTQVRHMSKHAPAVTDDQAHQIITAVKTNGFCHT